MASSVMLSTYSGLMGTFPPPPGASMVNCGTAYPVVFPLRARMISIPFRTSTLKWLPPVIRSIWYR